MGSGAEIKCNSNNWMHSLILLVYILLLFTTIVQEQFHTGSCNCIRIFLCLKWLFLCFFILFSVFYVPWLLGMICFYRENVILLNIFTAIPENWLLLYPADVGIYNTGLLWYVNYGIFKLKGSLNIFYVMLTLCFLDSLHKFYKFHKSQNIYDWS